MRYLSNSEAKAFKRCRRRWWLSWYRNLRPISASNNDALAKGSRVHEALASWYTPEGESRVNPLAALEIIIARDMPQVPEGTDPESDIAQALRTQWLKDTDLERAMLEGYVEWVEESGVDADLEVISSEQPLVAQLTEDVVLLGRLDARVRSRTTGMRSFIDHKTTAGIEELKKRLNQDEQLLTYFVLESAQESDVDDRTEGAMYNMLRKVKRTAKAKPPFYERHGIRFNREQVTTFIIRLRYLADDIASFSRQLDSSDSSMHAQIAYPNPTKDCSWDCPHKAVCPMFDDGSRAEDMIATHYSVTDLTVRYPELKELPV